MASTIDSGSSGWLTWTNQMSTRGMHLIGCKGATWPNHGLPRGTPGLANEGYVKIFGPGGFEPRTSPLQRLNKVSAPTTGPPVVTCYVCGKIIFNFCFCILAGGRAGA
jgi:hypothetical protein